jgi:hypothetical protein
MTQDEQKPPRRGLWRAGMWLLRGSLGLLCAGLVGWMALAILYSPLEPEWLRTPLSAAVPLAVLGALVWLRPLRRVPVLILVMFGVVLAAWETIEPSNDRDWQPDVEQLAYAEIDGDRVVVHNVRNANYRTETDFTVSYEDRVLDLSQVRSLDIFIVYWGSPYIAHTIMSWGFEDGQHIAVSIETRKEVGEEYSAIRGFFRQYELVYIVADERDVVRLRSNFRGEDVYLYRLVVPPEGPRLLLLAYLDEINKLHDTPQWYNALLDNCTTSIQRLASHLERRSWLSWKLFVNGFLDEHAYAIGAFNQSLPFAELKERSHINERGRAAGDAADFSSRIRAGLPGMKEGANP